MAGETIGHAPIPPEVRQAPVATPGISLLQEEQVSLDTRDNVGPPIFKFPAEAAVSVGELRLAGIVGLMRWNALTVLTKSDMTPEETDFVRTLRATPALDVGPISEWSKDDWRVSRHDTDKAFTIAETGYDRSGMRNAQAGFAQHLGSFIRRFPEGEKDMRELFQAIFKLGTSRDWEKNPKLAREVANAYWDVGERVLESWTAQPVRES